MRIGMAQMDISWENIEDNKKKVEEFFQKAVEIQRSGLYRISGK